MPNSAVFVIDMLNDCFQHKELAQRRVELCRSINELTRVARANGLPIVWIRQEFEPDLSDAFLDMRREKIHMFIKDTPGPQILEELIRETSDLETIKKRYSMFHGTCLDKLLDSMQVEHIILAGVNTHACIRMAAIDAFQRDYDVTVVRECVDSKDRRHHDVTLEYLDGGIARVVSLEEVKQFLKT